MAIQYAPLGSTEISMVFDQSGVKMSSIGAFGGRISAFSGCIGRFKANLPTQYIEFFAGHPQIGQGEQGIQLCGVLLQPAVANLHMAELAFDHPKRMLDLGADKPLTFN